MLHSHKSIHYRDFPIVTVVNISNFMQNSYAAADSVSVHIGANVLCSVVTR